MSGKLDDGAALLERLRPPGWQTGTSPQTAERERAVVVARSIVAGDLGFSPENVMVLARQFLRVLSLA